MRDMDTQSYASIGNNWFKARDPVVKHMYLLRANAWQCAQEDVQVRVLSTTYTLMGILFLLSLMLFATFAETAHCSLFVVGIPHSANIISTLEIWNASNVAGSGRID